ncbi:hypothetical protein [Hippea maritima]|uniref:Dihydroorotate dehydrogenase, electron transfer subunit, iron-sulfur cluster binding domain protein n=1 Tax=Hippea maritima (strain ATCC 700847 / DSM 10411 / MH2) TaxID=760142 RepID=F2LU84_HIPMA|nr:hypothetical protein [Hippea maritima]AEA34547.1 dihydroorotate dehydrogenase, electron transfer subunit, iron-sulfur cluster binding domain protein [Hippea maritima DSM 10411]
MLELQHEDFAYNIKSNFSKEELDFIAKKAAIVYSVCICLFLKDDIFIEVVGDSDDLQIYYHKGEEEKYISKKEFMDLINYKEPAELRVIEVD